MELQWPLILFTTFLAWSAGTFGAQSVAALKGECKTAQMPALITAAVLMAVGGIAVFFHLEHWERIFNGFGHITSGITQELIAIIVVAAAMVAYFVFLRRSEDGGTVPKWLAILSLVLSVVLVCVMGHSYNMASRPAWDSLLQIGSLVGAACAAGPATLAFIAALKNTEGTALVGTMNVVGTVVNVVLTVAFIAIMATAGSSPMEVGQWFDPTEPTAAITEIGVASPFAGEALGFTAVAIIAALVALVAALVGKKQGAWKVWGVVVLIGAIVSAICLRVVFYAMGVSIYPFFILY